jgi:hypothetical protein
MFEKQNKKVILGLVIAVFMITSASANTVSMTWQVHNDTSEVDSTTIDGWCTNGSDKLEEDNASGDADVSVCTTLERSGTVSTTWTYSPADGTPDVITSSGERTNAFNGMTKKCAVVTELNVGGGSGEWAWWREDSLAGDDDDDILFAKDVTGTILAHEVGHVADLDHCTTTTDRIMNATVDGTEDRAVSSEKDNFEDLNW